MKQNYRTTKSDIWERCYEEGWRNLITPEAFSHPAKFSRGLIHRIYKHAKEMGWVKPGDWVLDPFGGVALGGLDAMSMGLNWVAVELERFFFDLGGSCECTGITDEEWDSFSGKKNIKVIAYEERHWCPKCIMDLEFGKIRTFRNPHYYTGNIEKWNRYLGWRVKLGSAKIVQGDSRRLRDVIEKADIVVSSPPFIDQEPNHGQGKSPSTKRLESGSCKNRNFVQSEYGHTPGNLANMKEGDIDLICSSPPYADVVRTGEGTGATSINRTNPRASSQTSYGHSPGQLGSMPEGSIDLITSSPPYEDSVKTGEGPGAKVWSEEKGHWVASTNTQGKYGESIGQLGNSSGDTFWSASKEIVQGCYDLLKPGGHAIWVCKDYIKAKKRVPFSDRWLALCESVGFKLVCRHQASLVSIIYEKNKNGEFKTLERKSFFRRLAENKGTPRIDFEDVICVERQWFCKKGNK